MADKHLTFNVLIFVMAKGNITKEVDGRQIFSIQVGRKKGFGTGDCINYHSRGDPYPSRDLDTLCSGVDQELKSVTHHCDKSLGVSEKCYATCPEFCMSMSVPGNNLKGKGVPQLDTKRSYYAYFYPQYTKDRMLVTPVEDGFDREGVTEASDFVVKNLKTLLS